MFEDDEEVEELSEGDVSVVVLVDHLEHVGDERRVRQKTKRIGKLRLGEFNFTGDVEGTIMCTFYRLAGMTLVVLQCLRSHTADEWSKPDNIKTQVKISLLSILR